MKIKKIAIQMDLIEKIDFDFDTSFLLGFEAQQRGYEVFIITLLILNIMIIKSWLQEVLLNFSIIRTVIFNIYQKKRKLLILLKLTLY